MNKRNVILAAGLLILVSFVFFLETFSDPPLNWNDSFYKTDNIPLGSQVFFEGIRAWAGEDRFVEVNEPVFEFIRDSTLRGTYFLFNRSISWNSTTVHQLMDWVSAGNTLFMASSILDEFLLDTLGLTVERRLEYDVAAYEVQLDLVNPHLNPKNTIRVDREEPIVAFTGKETSWSTQVLGRGAKVKADQIPDWKEADINFISLKIGSGQILLHTYPVVFTNYFMLKENNVDYIRAILAYLPSENPLYYDNYYKAGKSYYDSPLYVLLGNPPLKMAYYILLAMAVLWVLFAGKRRQTAIPVIQPPKNQSLAFVDTLAAMYLAKGDHKTMAIHQINYLLEYLRRTHHLGTEHRDSEWRKRLSERYGESVEATDTAFQFIEELLRRKKVSTKELLQLNQFVTFYTHRHDSTR